MSSSLLAFAAGALGAAGAGLLAEPLAARRRGAQGPLAGRLVALLATAGTRLRPGGAAPRAPRDLAARIVAAGSPGGLGTRELMASKLAGAAAALAAGLVLGSLAPGRLGMLITALAPAAGFLAPDLWLVRRARERAQRVRRGLPGMLDLLRVTIAAGMPPAEALAEVGRRSTGPLAEEWRAVGRRVALGVPLAEALRASAERLPLPEVAALAAALERAARHGAPLGETLAAQALDARLARRRRVQEEAAKAGPKIQLVVALLLVPSVLLLVAAALLAALMEGGAGLLPV